MAKLRILEKRDVPAVAALFMRVYPGHWWSSRSACEAYFHEMLFDHPWRDLDLPSWVAEEDGGMSGCYAIQPRPMLFRGRRIRVAVGFQFMVDPDRRRSLTALQLAKACLSGSQDLTLADGASDQVRRGWAAIGGTAPLLYSLHWTRPLRPVRYLLSILQERTLLPPALPLAARPLGAVADALTGRLRPNRFYRHAGDLVEEPLDPATMLAHFPDVLRSYELQPLYDINSLTWLLNQAARKIHQGKLLARSVHDGGQMIGWYLYYLQPGGVSEVVQLVAQDGCFDRVLQRLLADAWRNGAAAARGRLDPPFVQELSDRHCWLRSDNTWTLVHSRHPELISAINQGEAFFSRLEGEWWLHCFGDGMAASSARRDWAGARHPRAILPASSARTQG